VRSYHERQLEACGRSWQYRDEDGTLLGQKVTPLDRVGIYVPGGKAAYPSSVLMNAIPAQVAGVGEIVMVVPTPAASATRWCWPRPTSPACTARSPSAARRRSARWRTARRRLPAVDKITGPGNAYVASAKRRVFGQVGIDMIAGPSEILVLADGTHAADWVAMDLFSQAEHDELAQAILLCPDAAYLDGARGHRPADRRDAAPGRDPRVAGRPRRADPDALDGRGLRDQQPHRARAPGSQQRRARALGAAAAPCRRDLPRRVHQREPGRLLRRPNHVLPTSGTARFSSPLGVYDFSRAVLAWPGPLYATRSAHP
jgi:histidinol dehydrogenase